MLLYKLYEKTQPDRSSQVDTVCEVQLFVKQLRYPNAYTAFLFISNQKPNAVINRDQGKLGIQKWWQSSAIVKVCVCP